MPASSTTGVLHDGADDLRSDLLEERHTDGRPRAARVVSFDVALMHQLQRFRRPAMGRNTEFELKGINHLALVSSDMARTVDFYTNVLGMPLIKTLEIPGGAQHFFFDCGNGDSL